MNTNLLQAAGGLVVLSLSTAWFLGVFSNKEEFSITVAGDSGMRKGDAVTVSSVANSKKLSAMFIVHHFEGSQIILRRPTPCHKLRALARKIRLSLQDRWASRLAAE